jgi:hypothetical protein
VEALVALAERAADEKQGRKTIPYPGCVRMA